VGGQYHAPATLPMGKEAWCERTEAWMGVENIGPTKV